MNKTKRILMSERIERAVTEKMNDIEVYDSKERVNYLDKYTIIIKGHIYAMSNNPNSPDGVCIYYGTIYDREYLERNNTKINIEDLPLAVQSKIKELYNDE